MIQRLIKFSVVGGIGFIVDATIFATLNIFFHWDLMLIRTIAFIGAATTTWLGNRIYTFSDVEDAPRLQQWKKFILAASISAVPNFVVFKLSLEWIGLDGWYVYIALVLGVLAGMISNFLLSSRWVFKASSSC
ncbi:GtrA family protein [Vibrio genomosp. F6]|uniref:Polysaccharide biosynthesis protein GtrA n=1 Tax=Vibrio genomosp. F6 str. FF-238 TaxID=1191298 RepID=A0A1E5D622_9VIBR|nr:GtrA family protein [Vibrio genomosp. F6]OEE79063.1 polysaccharide biosynthesis protein GtrA [Vibrio genomosp. F6 str. FF-238]